MAMEKPIPSALLGLCEAVFEDPRSRAIARKVLGCVGAS
jgi:hypothetical protein